MIIERFVKDERKKLKAKIVLNIIFIIIMIILLYLCYNELNFNCDYEFCIKNAIRTNP